jgi:pyruvate dehydrogenase E2 component (dihydrolipoamide acetyltransferase)
MAKTVIMPRFGMTQEEATIVRWIKTEGDPVEYGDPICEVTTDKINMEVEAPADGILAGLRYGEGDTVPVTAVIGYIVAEGEAPPAAEPGATPESVTTAVSTPATAEPATEKEVKATPLARRIASAEAVDLAAIPGSGQSGKVTRQDIERYISERPAAVAKAEPGKVRATPAARRLAQEHQVELSQVQGSGPAGRVQGWDITAALAAQSMPATQLPTAAAPSVLSTAPEVSGFQPLAIPLEGMRRTIAQRMQASWQQIPHILFTLDIDMTAAAAMREQYNARFGGGQAVVSMTAVLVKAIAASLRQHPMLNSYFRDDQILMLPYVNVGVAVALEEGLIVPVVREADTKSLYQIGQEVSDLSRRAREGSLRPEDVVDGTFTLSNLGMFGVDHFTAIINPPQVAILAAGRIARRFVPDEAGRPVARSMMTVTLSADHRAVDGAIAARFLATLRGILETAGAQWG